METTARVPRWPGRPAWVDDVLLPAGLAVFGWWGSFGAAENQPTSRPPDTTAWALLLLASSAVAFRRRRPVAVFGAAAAATAGWLALRYPYGPIFLPLCVAVSTIAAATPRSRFPAVAACVAALLVALVRRKLPDVVLMDVRMPVVDGIEATRTIAADPRLARVRVVILTTYELDEYLFDGLRAGASGFLVKDTDPVELLRAIRVVAAGEALLSPGATRRLIANLVALGS